MSDATQAAKANRDTAVLTPHEGSVPVPSGTPVSVRRVDQPFSEVSVTMHGKTYFGAMETAHLDFT